MVVAAAGAQAQAVYRTVGPDGKVIFSDKPPVDSTSNVTVSGKPKAPLPERPGSGALDAATGLPANSPQAARAAAASAAAAAAAADAADRKLGPMRAPPAAPPPNNTGPADPALARAVAAGLAHESLVTQMEDICLRTLPTSSKRYTVSEAWKQRNVALLNKMRMVLADNFAGAQRVAINADMKAEVEKTLGPVDKATPAARIKWCDKSSDEVASGVMDLAVKANIAQPLNAYKLR